MNVVPLVAWVLAATAGATVLVRWLGHRGRGAALPVRLLGGHLASAVIAIGLWVAYLATDRLLLAWFAFAVLNVTNGLGDAILTGRWRATAGVGRTWLADYRSAVVEVLRGRRPAAATWHALLGAVTYFSALVACVAVSL